MSLDNRIEYLIKKGDAKRARSRWYKKWWVIILLLIASAILIYVVSLIFLVGRLAKNPADLGNFLNSRSLLSLGENIASTSEQVNIKIIEGESNYFIGGSEAIFTVVVFSDFNCPYCQKSSDTVTKLAVKYGNKIKIIVRDYPVIGENSLELAMAARCAGEQDKYWPMYYKLFELQGQFTTSDLTSIAQAISVNDLNKFSQCLHDEKYKTNIIKDASDAQFLKIEGTPAWFINGEKAGEGNIPFEAWTSFLDNYLQ
ncbi:MAG TPA: thioredoxin domain-containing protein [bacterium]|nr:thioredoxin domain-containing protein [bacterium]